MNASIVTQVTGQVWVREADGSLTPIQQGMEIPANAQLVTGQGASVELQPQGQQPFTVGESREVRFSPEVAQANVDPTANAVAPMDAEAAAVLAAIDAGDDPFTDLDPTAAVQQAGGEGSDGSSFTRLVSVIETTVPLALEYPRPSWPTPEEVRLSGFASPGNAAPQLTADAALLLDQLNDDSDFISGVNVGQYFNDPDGHALTFSATGLPPGLSINPITGVISGTIDRSASQGGSNSDGIYNVVITATDPLGASVDLPFTWTTLNPPPVANDDYATTEENTVVEGNILDGYRDEEGNLQGADYDPDGDAITVVGVSPETNPDNVITWVPVDNGGVTISGTNGTDGKGGGEFVLYPDGSYTFNPGTDFDYLQEGETTTTTISYQISDGEGGFDTAILEITITGTNDAPIISTEGTDDAATVTELEDNHPDENKITHKKEGTITFSDADHNDSHTISVAEDATYLGNFVATLNADKTISWEFAVEDQAIDHLMEGQKLVQEYVVTIKDANGGETTQTVTITIVGANDAPIITDESTITGSVTEDDPDANVAKGKMEWTDADKGDNHTWAADDAGKGQYGTLVIDESGNWTYTLDNTNTNVQALGVGETLTEEIWVTVTDTEGASDKEKITITINGTNDDPVIESKPEDAVGIVKEAGHDSDGKEIAGIVETSGKLEASDVDVNDAGKLEWSFDDPNAAESSDGTGYVIQGEYGTIYINSTTGEWTYTLDNTNETVNKLNNGDSLEEKFDAIVKDAHGGSATQEITVTIQGTNDKPIANADVNEVTEAGEGKNVGPDATTNDGKSQAKGNIITGNRDGTIVEGAADTDVDNKVGELSVITVKFNGTEYKITKDSPAVINTDYADITINSDGSYTYTLRNNDANVQALKHGEKVDEVFEYVISDGAAPSDSSNLTITITGTNDRPFIDTTAEGYKVAGSVVEAGYEEDGTSTAEGKVTADDLDADHKLTWGVDVKDLKDGQTNKGTDGDKQTIDGIYGTFVINTKDGTWTYTLDNEREATQKLSDKDIKEEIFTVRVKDEHGAWVNQDVTVTVQGTNDAPVANPDVHKFNEDPDRGFVEGNILKNDTNPEGPLSVIKVTIGDETCEVPADGTYLEVHLTATGTTTDEAESIGTLNINKDGSYTFTPKEHYSGDVPVIYYTVQEGGEDVGEQSLTSESTLTFEITPVADAPKMEAPEKLWVLEDGTIALGLEAPLVVDNQDLNGENNGDNPELLGVITIAGIPEGAIIHGLPNGNVTSDGQPIKVVISDHAEHGHINGAAGEEGVITLTKEQFENLSITPPKDNANNFDITVDVTSYEVDSNGNPLNGIPGAENSTTTEVNVLAVTDEVSLEFADGVITDADDVASFTIDEDSKFDLSSKLEAAFEDLDGSEDRTITIESLPEGSKIFVDGKSHTIGKDGTITINAKAGDTGQTGDLNSFPKIEIQPPQDFSGDIKGVKVTLSAKDTDPDNKTHEDHIKTESDSVEFNLYVEPIAGDIKIGAVTGDEDNAIKFLEKTGLTDTDGSEVITKFVIKGVPAGWIVKDADGNVVPGLSGGSTDSTTTYVLVAPNSEGVANLDAYAGWTVTPPAHSSEDATFKVDITTKDTKEVNGETITDIKEQTDVDLKVTVNPVAEIIDGNYDSESNKSFATGDDGDDLTMTKGHDYSSIKTGAEDGWFQLNVDGFDLSDRWYNADGKTFSARDADGKITSTNTDSTNNEGAEETFALLTPILVQGIDGEDATGAKFSYIDDKGKEIVLTFNGKNAIEVPVWALDTLKFQAPEHVSGKFDIRIQTKTVDYDADDVTVKDSAVSGQSWLTGIMVKPVADGIESISVQAANGKEDQPIELSIKPSSVDPSEVFNIKISEIPKGSVITYNGQPVAWAQDEGGNDIVGTVIIENYDDKNGLTIQPPHNSNDNFELKVQGQTVDKVKVDGVEYRDTSAWIPANEDAVSLHVNVKGVADEAEVTIKGDADNPVEFTEAALDGHAGVTKATIALNKLVGDIELHDTDGSETLSIKISDLPEGFNVTGENLIFMGGEGVGREWVISIPEGKTLSKVLEGITIVTPEHFSGKLPGSIAAVTTENDGDSLVGEKHDFNAIVTPSLESTLNANTTIDEDTLGKVNFGIANNHGDDNESLTAVYIKVEDVEGQEFTLYLGDQTATKLADSGIEKVNIDGVEYYKVIGENINNIYAKADANFAHNDGSEFKFDVKYEVTDESNDGSVPAVTDKVDSTHSIQVTPVTDPVELKGFDAVEITDHSGFSVDFTIAKKPDTNAGSQADTDGSEQFTQVVVTGVPEGMVIDGIILGSGDNSVILDSSNVVFLGDGKWLVNIPASEASSFKGDITGRLQFKAGNFLSNGKHDLGVTVVTQDKGAENIATDSKGLTINADIKGGGGTADPDSVSTDVESKDFKGTEDEPFNLSEVIEVTINNKGEADGSLETHYSVIVKLPEGAQIFNGDHTNPANQITSTLVDGEEVWVISGKGNQAALDDMLGNLTVIPPADFNNNKEGGKGLPLDVTITTYLDNGSQDTSNPDLGHVPLTPVTDGAVIEMEFSAADYDGKATNNKPHDGSDVVISLNVQDGVDTNSEFGDKVYIQITESNGLDDGSLFDADGNDLTKETFEEGNDQGLPAGEYYVATLPEGATSVDVRYVPSEENRYTDGKLDIEAWVQSKEQGADNWETKSSNGSVAIEAINNGFDVTVGEKDTNTDKWVVSGTENQSKSGGNGAIKLDISGNGLLDKDGSEQVMAAKLEGVPNGFLVYIDGKLASNAGGEGDTNTWLIPVTGGQLPDNISILPPQFWSGVLDDLELSVLSGEKGQETWGDSFKFDFVVDPAASGIQSLAPTTSFSDANGVINLNLNIALVDRVNASLPGAPDASQETVGLKFEGLGQNAMFVLDGKAPDHIQFTNNGYTITYESGSQFTVEYDTDGNSCTVTGLSPEDANNLGVIQTQDQVEGKVKVEAWTEDGDDISESTNPVEFEVKIPDQAPSAGTSGNDIIVGGDTAQLLDGGAGNDIIYGGVGNDTLIGGAGNDILIGGAGDDTFKWNKGDEGSIEGAPAVDRIMDFGVGSNDPNGNDTLDISALLDGSTEETIDQYLTVTEGSGDDTGKTVIEISSKGGGKDAVDQIIVLDNIEYDAGRANAIANSLKDGILKSSDFD